MKLSLPEYTDHAAALLVLIGAGYSDISAPGVFAMVDRRLARRVDARPFTTGHIWRELVDSVFAHPRAIGLYTFEKSLDNF